MIKFNSIRVSSKHKELPEMMKYALENGCGIELRYPAPFDTLCNKCDFKRYLQELAKTLKNFPNKVSIHGFSYDVNPVSEDVGMRALSQKRLGQSLEVAKAIGADVVNFHTGYTPAYKALNYEKYTKKDLITFWGEFIKKFEKSKKIATLENSMENGPEFIYDIVSSVNSPNLKICLDVGHVNIHSKLPLEGWVEKSKKFLHHIHLHNNDGVHDLHKPFTEGTINFNPFFETLERENLSPNIIFEVKTMEATEKSLNGFRKMFNT